MKDALGIQIRKEEDESNLSFLLGTNDPKRKRYQGIARRGVRFKRKKKKKKRKNERTKERKNERTKEQKNERTYERTYERIKMKAIFLFFLEQMIRREKGIRVYQGEG